MGILSWLRRSVADFFGADTDAVRRACDLARTRADDARRVAAAAVAQARRAALQLQDLLSDGEPSPSQLGRAVAEAEDAQRRADELVSEYRKLVAELRTQLDRAEELQLLETANEERERLARSEPVESDIAALEERHDDVRAEAARLDALERLRTGTFRMDDQAEPDDEAIDGLKARAEAILTPSNESDT